MVGHGCSQWFDASAMLRAMPPPVPEPVSWGSMPPLPTGGVSELARAHDEVAATVGAEQYLHGIEDLLADHAKREAEVSKLRDRFAALWELEAVG